VANYFEVKTVVEYEKDGQKKSRWIKCGVAFPLRNGEGFSVTLDALPVNGKLVIMPPLPQGERGGRQQGGGYDQSQGGGSDGGQDIPFSPLGNV
jgi:hypothetical protein